MVQLLYVPYKDIDRSKWDQCIKRAANALIYAESVYLDHMSPNWDAIILNDYEAVMPLTWKRKLGIKYLCQPPFFQQGGIFSSKPVTAVLINDFIELASKKIKFAELTLNYANIPAKESPLFTSALRNNFILPLKDEYKTIHSRFHTDLKQSIKKTAGAGLIYKKTTGCKEAINLYRKLYGERFAVSNKEYNAFQTICEYYLVDKRVLVREVYDKTGMELLAAVLLLKDKKRLYNIISCTLPKGKRLLANYFLYNELVKEFAGKELLLDFEGSDLPGVAFFYRKFTTVNQQYPFIKYNLLPAPVRLLKH